MLSGLLQLLHFAVVTCMVSWQLHIPWPGASFSSAVFAVVPTRRERGRGEIEGGGGGEFVSECASKSVSE